MRAGAVHRRPLAVCGNAEFGEARDPYAGEIEHIALAAREVEDRVPTSILREVERVLARAALEIHGGCHGAAIERVIADVAANGLYAAAEPDDVLPSAHLLQ